MLRVGAGSALGIGLVSALLSGVAAALFVLPADALAEPVRWPVRWRCRSRPWCTSPGWVPWTTSGADILPGGHAVRCRAGGARGPLPGSGRSLPAEATRWRSSRWACCASTSSRRNYGWRCPDGDSSCWPGVRADRAGVLPARVRHGRRPGAPGVRRLGTRRRQQFRGPVRRRRAARGQLGRGLRLAGRRHPSRCPTASGVPRPLGRHGPDRLRPAVRPTARRGVLSPACATRPVLAAVPVRAGHRTLGADSGIVVVLLRLLGQPGLRCGGYDPARPVLHEIGTQEDRDCVANVVQRKLAASPDRLDLVIAGASRPQLLVELGRRCPTGALRCGPGPTGPWSTREGVVVPGTPGCCCWTGPPISSRTVADPRRPCRSPGFGRRGAAIGTRGPPGSVRTGNRRGTTPVGAIPFCR